MEGINVKQGNEDIIILAMSQKEARQLIADLDIAETMYKINVSDDGRLEELKQIIEVIEKLAYPNIYK